MSDAAKSSSHTMLTDTHILPATRVDKHSSTVPADDSFELYDLRIEMVCPPGARILCGAKEGDHFTLEGELLHLPPGQGFSIYSLGMYNCLSNKSLPTLRRH